MNEEPIPQRTVSYRLEAHNICKRFGALQANDKVSLSIEQGTIHGLIGENGAGKSTLVKMIYGLQQPDSGSFLWEGKLLKSITPPLAQELGIGMVFQHFSLFDSLSVVENIALGLKDYGNLSQLRQRVMAFSEQYNLAISPDKPVFSLTAGERQRTEILRCLLRELKLLIMDEPTSVLTLKECDELFGILERLTREGKSVLYISHKLLEIKRICKRATILRRGKNVGQCNPSLVSQKEMAEMMIGQELRRVQRRPQTTQLPLPAEALPETPPFEGTLFEIKDLSYAAHDPFRIDLHNVGIGVRRGEILGIAGVAGNGQDTLCDILSGEILTPERGQIFFDGQDIGRLRLSARQKRGIEYIPEDRLSKGTVRGHSLSRNVFLTHRKRPDFNYGGVLDFGEARKFSQKIISIFDVRASAPNPPAASLSGGNLQKWLFGRSVLSEPRLLIVNSPTWGVDAGAVVFIHQKIVDLAAQGVAVILISQDLEEIFTLSDTIAVICGGELSPSYPAQELNQEKIGLLLAGVSLEAAS